MKLYLDLAAVLALASAVASSAADDVVDSATAVPTPATCDPPAVLNGRVVSSASSPDHFLGTVECDRGYIIMGKSRIKCRRGIWSAKTPVCTMSSGSSCQVSDLPVIRHGRHIPVRGFRGSVMRYKCDRGFRIFGQAVYHCQGTGWSANRPPICAARGCDLSEMSHLENGEAAKLHDGSIFRFRCNSGSVLSSDYDTVFCDSGRRWNASKPVCSGPPPLGPNLAIVDEESGQLIDIDGSTVGEGKTVRVACSEDLKLTRRGEVTASDRTELVATRRDNGAKFGCVDPDRISDDVGSSEDLQLRVLYFPKEVKFQSPRTVTVSRAVEYGDTVVVACSSSPSNPPASIRFRIYANDNLNPVQVVEPTETATHSDSTTDMVAYADSWSEYSRGGGYLSTARMSLNAAAIRSGRLRVVCAADGARGREVTDEMTVTVEYAPDRVRVKGPSRIRFDEPARFTCLATPSRPAPDLKWRVGVEGQDSSLLEGTEYRVVDTEDGQVASVTLTLDPDEEVRKRRSHSDDEDGFEYSTGNDVSALSVECFASHSQLGDDMITYTHFVELLYPPSAPRITVERNNDEDDTSGWNDVRLECAVADAGHPRAELRWAVNGRPVEAAAEGGREEDDDGDVNSSVLRLTSVPDGTVVSCEASNEAILTPLSAVVRINHPTTTTATTSSTTATTEEIAVVTEKTVIVATELPSNSIFGHLKSNEEDDDFSSDDDDAEDKDDYYGYDDTSYVYEYPEESMPTEEYYEHPELAEEEVFKHKVDLLELDTSKAGEEPQNKKKEKKKSEELDREREFNEIYPKERASKHGGANSSSNLTTVGSSMPILLICSMVLALTGQV